MPPRPPRAPRRARSNVDASRLSSLVSRPGIDPRIWLTIATVDELGFDAQEGIFADVTFVPTGERETAFVGAAYAGNQFGLWCAPEVGDLVLVAVPAGDSGEGPVIVARMWRAADRPHVDMRKQGTTDEPTSNVVLRLKDGTKLVIRTSGADGEIDIQAEGTAHVKIRAGGQVQLQDASQSFVRGENYADALGTFLTALNVVMVAVGTFATAVGVAVPPVAPAAVTLNTAIGVFTNAITTFSNARTAYLSQKVKGQ